MTVEQVTKLEAGRLALRVVPPEGMDLQFTYRAALSIYWNPDKMQLEDRSESEVSFTSSASRIARALREEYRLHLIPAADLLWSVDVDMTGEIACALFEPTD